MKVTNFRVSSLPSFPSIDMIPSIDDEEFDKKISQWWDEIKVNLDKQTSLIEELRRKVETLEQNQ